MWKFLLFREELENIFERLKSFFFYYFLWSIKYTKSYTSWKGNLSFPEYNLNVRHEYKYVALDPVLIDLKFGEILSPLRIIKSFQNLKILWVAELLINPNILSKILNFQRSKSQSCHIPRLKTGTLVLRQIGFPTLETSAAAFAPAKSRFLVFTVHQQPYINNNIKLIKS